MRRLLTSRVTRVTVFMACLGPLEYLGWRGLNKDLTANPIEFITHKTGDWTLRFLLITLAITPLRVVLNQPQMIRFRRMVGLFAFFYGLLHLSTWMWLDKGFDVSEMWKDVVKRRFITSGMVGLLLMAPLAVTSTAGWVRRLGYTRWQLLHRAIYFSALAGVIHYYWGVKSDIRLPVLYGAIFSVLMLYRAGAWMLKRNKRARVESRRDATSVA